MKGREALLAGLFIASLVVTVLAVNQSGEYEVAAEQARDSIALVKVELGKVQLQNLELAELGKEQELRYSQDSLSWEQERHTLRMMADDAFNQTRELSASLAEHMAGDTLGLSMLEDLQAQHRIVITSMTGEITSLQAERSSLWVQRETLGLRVGGLEQEVVSWADLSEQKDVLNAAVEDALRAERNKKLGLAGALAAALVLLTVM